MAAISIRFFSLLDAAAKSLSPVPIEMIRMRPHLWIIREMKSLPVVAGEKGRILTKVVLRKMLHGHDHLVVVRESPEAVVKQPMGVLAQGETIPDIVVP